LQSEKIGDYAYEIAKQSLMSPEAGTVRATLAAYRQIGW
jgi:hypothetical protein